MMKKLLVLIVPPGISEEWLEFLINMNKCLNAYTIVISIIDPSTISRVASNEGIKEAKAKERLLHAAFLNLYHVEETFKNKGVEVTIATKCLLLPDLIAEVKKFNPVMVCVAGSVETTLIESLKESVSIPILFFPVEKK